MPDVTDLRPGDPEEIAGYRVVSRLGAGGQGVVYLATSPSGVRVAIKRLRLEDDRTRQQFVKEVAAARRVAAFCTARVLAVELDGPSPYVVSEYIDGPSLQQHIDRRGPMADASLQRLAIGTITALAAIHQAGVVHRDFKPANVMLSSEGPRVIDFGIARDLSTETTVTSRIFGTPAYMAPEQLKAGGVGAAADLFAWASVIAFAATGKAPFAAPHMMAVVYRITSGEPDLTGVPDDLLGVLRRCLDKDPDRRPSAQQVLALLLGRPAPERDVTDPTVVLAEATGIVHDAGPPTTVPFSGSAFPTVPRSPTAAAPVPPVPAAPTTEFAPNPTTAFEPPPRADGGDQGRHGTGPSAGAGPRAGTGPSAGAGPRAGTGQGAGHGAGSGPGPEVRPWGHGIIDPDRPAGPSRAARRRRAAATLAVVALLLAGIWRLNDLGMIGDRTRGPWAGAGRGPSGAETPAPQNSAPDTDVTSDPATGDPSNDNNDNNDGSGNSGPGNNNDDSGDAGDTIPEEFDGSWEGFGHQPPTGPATWTARIDLDQGETTGTMELEELNCSGPLTLTSIQGDTLIMSSVIDDNPSGACADAGTVRLRRAGNDRLNFFWVAANNANNTAAGVLRAS